MKFFSLDDFPSHIKSWSQFAFGLHSRYSLFYLFISLLIFFILNSETRKQVVPSFKKDSNPLLKANRPDVLFCLFYLTGLFTFEIFGRDPIDALRMHVNRTLNITRGGLYDERLMIIWSGSVVFVIDFCGYWSHRIMHTFRPLWFFHASHHSAKVINYYTVLRMHPIDTFIIRFIPLVGLTIYFFISRLLFPQLSFKLLAISGIFWETIFASTAFLRHSSLVFYFPKWLSYIFMSPGMHLIHHDVSNPRENKNYARIFAFWDYFFGTWEYNRPENKPIQYGISEKYQYKDESFLHLIYHPFVLLVRHFRKDRK